MSLVISQPTSDTLTVADGTQSAALEAHAERLLGRPVRMVIAEVLCGGAGELTISPIPFGRPKEPEYPPIVA